MIQAEGLTKRFDAVTAVDDVSIQVGAHEVVGMVGINGAGKTTCLRMLAGIIPPTSGSIRIMGHPLTGEEAGDGIEARRQLAFVPDTPMLFETLTPYEHLLFVARLYGVDDPEPGIDALLDEFDLEARRHTTASALSRGMRQKLAICCAFLHAPPVLLLDEPLTGLDPRGRRNMCEAIARRQESGSAIIISSHQLEFVERLSTRYLIVHQGRIRADGTLEDIRASADPSWHESSLEDIFLHTTDADDAS